MNRIENIERFDYINTFFGQRILLSTTGSKVIEVCANICAFSFNIWRAYANTLDLINNSNHLFDLVNVFFYLIVCIQRLYLMSQRSLLKERLNQILKLCKSSSMNQIKRMSSILTVILICHCCYLCLNDYSVTFYYGIKKSVTVTNKENLTGSASVMAHLKVWGIPIGYALFAGPWFTYIALDYMLCFYCVALAKDQFLEFLVDHIEWSVREIRRNRIYWRNLKRSESELLEIFEFPFFCWITNLCVIFCLLNTQKTLYETEKDALLLMINEYGEKLIGLCFLLSVIYFNHFMNSRTEFHVRKFHQEFISHHIDDYDDDRYEMREFEFELLDQDICQNSSRKVEIYSIFQLNSGYIFTLANCLVPLAVLIAQLLSDPCP